MHYYAQKGYFKFGICLTGSKHLNKDFDFLPDAAVWEDYDEDRLKQYLEVLEQRAMELKKKVI